MKQFLIKFLTCFIMIPFIASASVSVDWDSYGFSGHSSEIYSPEDLGVNKNKDVDSFLSLEVVYMSDASWNIEELKLLLKEALDVFSQCGVGVENITFHHVENYFGKTVLYRFPDSSEQNSAIHLINNLPVSRNKLRVMFISKFIERPSAGKAFGFWKDKRLDNYLDTSLPGTVWITKKIKTDEYKDRRKNFPYNIVAHELMHVLIDSKQHLSPKMYPPNILSTFISKKRNNIILPQHCDLIKNRPAREF